MMLLLLEEARMEIGAQNSVQNSAERCSLAEKAVGNRISRGDRVDTEGRGVALSVGYADQVGVVRDAA